MPDTFIYCLFIVFVVCSLALTLIIVYLIFKMASDIDRRVDDLEQAEYRKVREEEMADD